MDTTGASLITEALESIDFGLWIGRAPVGDAVFTNRRFTQLVGALLTGGQDAPAGAPRLATRSGQPYPLERSPIARAFSERSAVIVDDLLVMSSDGEPVPVRLTARRLSTADDALSLVVATAVDVSSEVAAQAEETLARRRLRVAVDHAPVVLWAIDRVGIITLSEGAALEALGLRPGQLVGQSVFDIYKDHPTVPGYLKRALEGESLTYAVEVGESFFETWVAPLRDDDGQLTGAIGVSTDTTRRMRLQAKVIQDDRVVALGTLAASVAHEINNPLTYALLSLGQLEQQLLLAKSSSTQDARKALELMDEPFDRLREGLQRIHHVTHGLRSFTRPDDRLTLVDVRSALDSVLRIASKDVESRAKLVLAISTTPPVKASEAGLGQVFINLIHNALHAVASREGPHEICVRTRADDQHVIVTISDTGPGIPRELRQRLFEPFITSKPVGEGTGLGLFVCRNIVRGLGGEIALRDRDGGGAEFDVLLPIARPDSGGAGAPVATARPEVPEVTPARLLLVDDDIHVGTALARALELAGHSVTYVQDGRKAIELLTGESSFDLCFCDVVMPGVSGMDVHAAVKAHAPGRERQIVFMTGGAYTATARTFFESIPDQRVEKPFDIAAEARRRLAR